MKRVFIFLSIFQILSSSLSYCQEGHGGQPLSMQQAYAGELSGQAYIPVVSYQAPDIAAMGKANSSNASIKLLRIGAVVRVDIDIIKTGTITTLSNGQRICRLKVNIADAPAIGLYYDKFSLCPGVRYYISNANGRQLLGAYTSENNPPANINEWANEKVQGDIVNLEIDIDADVDITNIQLHINGACVFYKSTEYLKKYETSASNLRTTNYYPYNHSSPCEVNALCSSGFVNQRNATVHIEYLNAAHTLAYAATGTMINNTSGDCTPYVLTASHVEPTNSTLNSSFTGWIFYYNYQTSGCTTDPTQPALYSVTGAKFVARSILTDTSANGKIAADFLLLKLYQNPPASYGAYLAGWDRNDALLPIFGTFVSFHHPDGDVKKVSTATSADPTGSFNGGATNSHWSINWSTGGTEEGSSGGPLFNSSGNEIGILSGGYTQSPSCTTPNTDGKEIADHAQYSKFSFDWTYASAATQQLKPWLDPTNSGATTLGGVSACAPTAVRNVSADNSISIYPNPNNGTFYVAINNGQKINIIEVYNSLGQTVYNVDIDLYATKYKIDFSNYSAGVYMLRIKAGEQLITRKFTIVK
ncbi:MAG: T9SS type A sorting domain-containing protein [Taibaiella sp.]|nr:T9SS type A sorting domain-containing protein [Taibaiella sp.]